MSTEQAQRRLLEALGDLRNTPGQDIGTSASPLDAFAVGADFAAEVVIAQGEPGQAGIFAALAELARAVDHDQRQESGA